MDFIIFNNPFVNPDDWTNYLNQLMKNFLHTFPEFENSPEYP
jgi:hypothetical protein